MSGMVANTGQPLDDRGYSRQRPKIGVKPLRPSASAEGPVHLLQLFLIQLGLATRPACRLQGADTALAPLTVPATDTLAAHPQHVGHGGQDFAGTKQTRRLFAPIFQSLEIPSRTDRFLHVPIMHETAGIVTVLCKIH